MNDLRYAFRQLVKSPGFTAVAVLTLALGIGANLALFTLLDDQFLRPRAVLRPEELWQICPSDASGAPKFFHLSRPYYDGIRKYNRVFKDLISIHGLTAKLRTSDAWEEIFGNIVSANYFSFVGVHTVVGRGLLPADERPDANPVAVISYALWQKHFGGEQAIAGKILNLDGRTFEVVGVAPPGFVGLASHLPDCWVTSSAEKLYYPSPTYTLIGRLENGISPAAAADSLAPIVQEVTRMLHPVKYNLDNAPFDANNNSEFTRVALLRAGYGCKDRQFAHHDRGTLIKVNSLAGFGTLMVLLMAASNLANLLLARGLDRRKELATRLALGATRPALVRQLALEGVLLVALGTLAALVTLNGF